MDVYLRLFGNQITSSFLAVMVSIVPALSDFTAIICGNNLNIRLSVLSFYHGKF